MIDLSRVTLLFVATQAHDITKRVISDCWSKVKFGETLVYTNDQEKIGLDGIRYIPCHNFINKREAGAFYYGKAMEKVETDFALMLEWDGGIFDTAYWKPEFFSYDYIGAPWQVRRNDTRDVGNGGFTLMSKRLGHFICENFAQHPVFTDVDVCRNQRGAYDAAGFKWPDRQLASSFAWELGLRNPEHFGFHGAFTWPTVLPTEELIIRTGLLTETPYLMAKMYHLVLNDPDILGKLPPEQTARFTATYGNPLVPVSEQGARARAQRIRNTQMMRDAIYARQRARGQTA